MRTVYKYPALFGGEFQLRMPVAARIVKIGEQRGKLMMWAEIESDNPPVTRTFQVFGTGHGIPLNCFERKYIHVGTVQTLGMESFVWHLYEVMRI